MIDRLTHAKWSEAGKRGELFGQQCPECGAMQGTPKAACPHCRSTELETVELSTEGFVYTETTINVPPAGVDTRGYQVAVVDLGAGRVLGHLNDQAVDIGDRVVLTVFIEDNDGYVAPKFEAE